MTLEKLEKVGMWVLTIFLACVFFFGGYAKLRDPEAELHFASLGWPVWLRLVLGASEMICGAFLLLPWLVRYAAVPLVVAAGVAAASYLWHPQFRMAAVWPLAFIALLVWLARYRRSVTAG